MIDDVEAGKINCIVTKDLSRLGRDYIMTGHYIEKYFPEHNVRYIAVNDGVDTFENSTNNDMTPFKAVFNDMYAKDISKKVRTSLNTMKQNGDFIGSVPPYGYKKDTENKHHLVIDEETAPVVKKMYSLYINGKTVKGIADFLTKERIPTPSQQKKLKATQQPLFRGVWNDAIVRRILTNPTYIGNITQNRASKINYKVNRKRKIDKDNWIVVEGTHEPIVTQKEFDAVQTIMQKKAYHRQPLKNSSNEHLLAGLLYCADCKKRMTFHNDKGVRPYTVCSTFRAFYGQNLCTSHRVREDHLETAVIKALKEHAKKYVDKEFVIEQSADADMGETELIKQQEYLQIKLDEFSRTLTNAYMDKVRGILSENDFLSINQNISAERTAVVKQISELAKQISKLKELHKSTDNAEMRELLENFLQFEDINHNMLTLLIEKIVINDDRSHKIYFNFCI